MDSLKAKTDTFLRQTGMHAECIVLDDALSAFMQEMRRGLNGEPSSLPMLPTYLSAGTRPVNRRCIALDAGGTNFRVALLSFDESGVPTVEYKQKMPMPGTQGRISRREFFRRIAKAMLPIADKSDEIGFCFSFPSVILPNREGRLIDFCKEVQVEDASGMMIGQELNAALAELGYAPKHITILNDTVAALLSGVADDSVYDGYIGFILGTGTNLCYLEKTSQIGKIMDPSDTMIVNVESGMYSGFFRGEFDRELDAGSEIPNDHLAEKMISGAYIGELIHKTLVGACREGLFSAEFCQRFSHFQTLSSTDISNYCLHKSDSPLYALASNNAADAEALWMIVDNTFDRAAKLVAITLAAIMEQTDTGRSADRPCAVTAEGSTFYHAPLFRPKLDHYLNEWLRKEHHRYVSFLRSEDATLFGAATAAVQA